MCTRNLSIKQLLLFVTIGENFNNMHHTSDAIVSNAKNQYLRLRSGTVPYPLYLKQQFICCEMILHYMYFKSDAIAEQDCYLSFCAKQTLRLRSGTVPRPVPKASIHSLRVLCVICLSEKKLLYLKQQFICCELTLHYPHLKSDAFAMQSQ